MKKGMDMEKNRMKRWFVTGSMILIILAAAYMLSQSLHDNSNLPGNLLGDAWLRTAASGRGIWTGSGYDGKNKKEKDEKGRAFPCGLKTICFAC